MSSALASLEGRFSRAINCTEEIRDKLTYCSPTAACLAHLTVFLSALRQSTTTELLLQRQRLEQQRIKTLDVT